VRAALVLGSQIVGISLAIAVAGGIGLAASIIAFLVVVVGPGAVVTRALTSGQRLGIASTAVLATGLGISLTLAAGLLLDRSPISLFWLGPILIGVTAVSLAWPAWRRRGARGPRRILSDVVARYSIDYDEAVMLLVAITLVTGALIIARANAEPHLASGAQLWIVPAEGVAEVGAANIGSGAESWRVVATEDGDVMFDTAIALAPGQRWASTLDLPDGHGAITVSLLGADGTPLREVSLAGDG
jgi:hypothetical protein